MSAPEEHFVFLWQCAGGPDLIPEYYFHETRKWRADFALVESGVLIEIEGGVHAGGRHTRGTGFSKDAEKYLAATLAGWRLVRLTPAQLNLSTIENILTWTQKLPKPSLSKSRISPTAPAGKNGGSHSSTSKKRRSKTAS